MTYDPNPGEVPPELPDDPFGQFETTGEVAAYVWHKCGEDGLRQLLEHDVSNPILSREDVMDAADELGRAGLRKAASIATEMAATKPPMTDLSFCCYTKPPYVGQVGNVRNIEAWQRAEERRQSDAAHKRRRKKRARLASR